MNPDGARFAKTIIDQQSQLVRHTTDPVLATTNLTNVNAAATLNAFSASAAIFADEAAVEAAVTAAIANAGSTVGRFRIKVGDSPLLTVELDSADFAFANIAARINTMLAPAHGRAGDHALAGELAVEDTSRYGRQRRSH